MWTSSIFRKSAPRIYLAYFSMSCTLPSISSKHCAYSCTIPFSLFRLTYPFSICALWYSNSSRWFCILDASYFSDSFIYLTSCFSFYNFARSAWYFSKASLSCRSWFLMRSFSSLSSSLRWRSKSLSSLAGYIKGCCFGVSSKKFGWEVGFGWGAGTAIGWPCGPLG